MCFFPAREAGRSLARAADQHVAATRAGDDQAVRAAFVEGQEPVPGLVRQAREDALRQLAQLGPALPPDLSAMASHRLEEGTNGCGPFAQHIAP